MPLCGCMSHVQSGLPLWPLVPMLALSLASSPCSPGLLDSLARVGLPSPYWCHPQGYEGVSLGTILLRMWVSVLHNTTYMVPTGTPMYRQGQVSLQVL